MRWLPALLVALSLIAGACGDDNTEAAENTEATTTAAADNQVTTTAAADNQVTTTAAADSGIDLSTFSTDRPESPMGGAIFDAVTFLTFPPEMGVCTWETLLLSTTEEEFLAADSATKEEAVVTAASNCHVDEEALSSLRLTLQRSELFTGDAG